MPITIYEGYDKTYVMLGSKDERFARAWGSVYKVPVSNLYKDLQQIAEWAKKELDEEVSFILG